MQPPGLQGEGSAGGALEPPAIPPTRTPAGAPAGSRRPGSNLGARLGGGTARDWPGYPWWAAGSQAALSRALRTALFRSALSW